MIDDFKTKDQQRITELEKQVAELKALLLAWFEFGIDRSNVSHIQEWQKVADGLKPKVK